MDKQLDDLTLHPLCRSQLDLFEKSDSQGILITGEPGVGLGTIAVNLAHILRAKKAMVQIINQEDKRSIGVETIQRLYHSLRTKHADAIVVVIDDAETMTLDAQNALLKLLEEPPEYASFILTSHAPESLLPTITSRVQEISVKKTPAELTDAIIPLDTDPKKRAQISFLATGYPAEFHRLMNDSSYFDGQVQLMSEARTFLTDSTFARLAYVQRANHSREDAERFLRMLAKLVLFSIDKQSKNSLLEAAEAIDSCLNTLRQNGNVRLQLTNLSLSLRHM